jgi:hypothetical protein
MVAVMVDGGVGVSPFAPRPAVITRRMGKLLTRSLVSTPMLTTTKGSVAVLALVLLLGLVCCLFRGVRGCGRSTIGRLSTGGGVSLGHGVKATECYESSNQAQAASLKGRWFRGIAIGVTIPWEISADQLDRLQWREGGREKFDQGCSCGLFCGSIGLAG